MPKGFPEPKKSVDVTGGVLTTYADLDQHMTDEFEQACIQLIDSGVRDLVIDLSQIDFVSSSCFGLILALQVKSISREKELSLKVKQDLVSVLDLLGVRSMIPTTVVRIGTKPKDFELQGARLVVTRNLEAGDHVSLQVWCRRLADVVSSAPVVDLTRIEEIDSRAMGVLTELWASCRQRGKRPVYEVSPRIHERLIDVNLDRVFEIKEIKRDSGF